MIEPGREEKTILPTNPAQVTAWRERTLPLAEQFRPNVWSVAIPFDLTPIRFTYCYVIAAPGGAIVIDPGWDTDAGWDALLGAIHAAQPASAGPSVQGVIITHFHPDHLALARRLRDATGAWVALHTDDEHLLRRLRSPRAADSPIDWMSRFGVPRSARQAAEISPEMAALRPRPDDVTRVLHGGETFATSAGTLVVIHTPGHTAGHVSVLLDDASLIFTGDHILPRITSSLEFRWFGQGNPLRDHLQSLQLCAELGDLEVAPAHEYRFRGLSLRVDELVRHHQARNEQIVSVYRSGASVWQVARSLSWSRPWESFDGFNMMLALAETACHLTYLAESGRIDWTLHPEELSGDHGDN